MSNMRFVIVFGLVVTGSCSSLQTTFRSHNKGRIVNGQDALSEQFPYYVELENIKLENSEDNETDICCSKESARLYRICGAALIGLEWVLTAAHCVTDAHWIELYMGTIDRFYAKECYIITDEKISIHPDYKEESKDNDIALINIPKTTLCDTVQVVPLPKLTASTEYLGYACEYAFTSGFGQTNFEEHPDRLQWARLLIIENNECAKRVMDVTMRIICAQPSAELASPSLGDSGGPLVLESTGELVGVTVAIADLGPDKGLPILFARVTEYLEWIKSISGIYY